MIRWPRRLRRQQREPLVALVERGLRLGEKVDIQTDVWLDPPHCWLIEIGGWSVLAPRVMVLAHDASTRRPLGRTKIGRVQIGSHVFVGAASTILPGVTIGDHAIVAAGSLVARDVPQGAIVAGVPAVVIGWSADYLERHRLAMSERPTFDESYTLRGGITAARKAEMRSALEDGIGYVE